MLEPLLDLRYIGQSYELTVPFSRDFRRRFDERHARLYGYADPARPIEIVNLRLKAAGLSDKPALPRSHARAHKPRAASIRRARFKGKMFRSDFYLWDSLAPGARAAGPAVITGAEATVVIPPGFGFTVDTFGNVIMRHEQ
jgi:N-methylhydantoinase A/oxoprolinase/acetone carboxylase beta subunit